MVRGGSGRSCRPASRLPSVLFSSSLFARVQHYMCGGIVPAGAPAPAGLPGSDRAAGRAYRVYWQGLPPLLLAVVLAGAVALGLLAPCIYSCINVLIRLSSVKTEQARQLHNLLLIVSGRACRSCCRSRYDLRQGLRLRRLIAPALQPSGAASDDLKNFFKKFVKRY